MRRTLALFLLLPFLAGAQERPTPPAANDSRAAAPRQPEKRRPRIGVALEGGGALGLAHIGVLQWFEEHHIPIDYIAGTSMGGLVGGFYASGMSSADLRKLIEHTDWDVMLSVQTDYQDLSFRRKEDQRAYPNSILLGLRNGLFIPGGLNAGHQIGLLIDRKTLPYYAVNSFDDLPVPFRCVATDLVSEKAVVFQKGPLAEALRATMSIPGAFTPVYEGKRVLVDGGLLNNLPTDVAREMGADIVIAVHLETQSVEPKDLKSLFSILQQSVRVVVGESELRGLAHADAVVSVPLIEYDSTDYRKNASIMQKGYETASQKSKMLETFALDDAAWQQYVREKDARKRTAVPVPEFVRVVGTSGQQASSVERYLKPLIGQPLDTEKLDRTLTRLTGLGRYDTLGYRIDEREGKQGLLISVREKNYAPPTVQPAFQVDGSESGEVNFNLASRLTVLDVAGFRSEWRTDFLFGNTYGVASELYRPFTPVSRWFFAPHADASDQQFQIYARNDPVADYRIYREDIGFDLGYAFSRFTEVRVGYEVGDLNEKLRLGTPEFSSTAGRVGATWLRYFMDHTDDPVVPRSGYSAASNFRWFDANAGATSAFPEMDAQIGYYHPITQPASVFLVGQGGTTFGSKNTGIPQFFLGGPLSLSAYGNNELFGNQYYLFRTGYLHDLVSLPTLLGKKVYVTGAFEFGKMYGAPNESKFPDDVTAGVLAETVLGPFFVGGSAGDSGHRKWFFQLGRVF